MLERGAVVVVVQEANLAPEVAACVGAVIALMYHAMARVQEMNQAGFE